MKIEDELLVQHASRIDEMLMRPLYVFRMAKAQLYGSGTPNYMKKSARTRMVNAAREIDQILRKEFSE